MKTIQLYDAVYFLNRCEGVLLEGRYIRPIVSEVEDDYGNEFLTLEWDEYIEEGEQEEGEEAGHYVVSVGFKEGDNQTIGLEGCVLTLMNSDGDEEELTLLREWHPLINSD